jgi:hypothetical protein
VSERAIERFSLTPLQYWLFTPELQWHSRGKRRISQGCEPETLGVGLLRDGDGVDLSTFTKLYKAGCEGVSPLQNRLFTPELQWQSSGKRRV